MERYHGMGKHDETLQREESAVAGKVPQFQVVVHGIIPAKAVSSGS
jgi:hypothetical protein